MQIDSFVLQSKIFRATREASGGRIPKLFLARKLEINLPLAVLNRNGRPLCGGYGIG